MLDTVKREDSSKVSVEWSVVGAKINYSPDDGKDGTEEVVTTAVEPNDFVWNTIHLGCER
jgi:hypothetical protein